MTQTPEFTVARQSAYRQSVQQSFADIATYLASHLGKTLLSFITGSSKQTVARWAKGDQTPTAEIESLVRSTYLIFAQISEADSKNTARAWFMGMNPHLDDASPTEAMKDARLKDVNTAAKAFLLGG